MLEERIKTVERILYGFDLMERAALAASVQSLPRKIVRHLAFIHPDNRTRKELLRLSDVAIGPDTVINRGILIEDLYQYGVVTFGARVSVAANVSVIAVASANNSRLADIPDVRQQLMVSGTVKVGDDAWLGANCVILPNVEIGCGAIVGAGAVVTKSVPSYTIVAGVPARAIRTLVAEPFRSDQPPS
jgi:acetyltransferase-like isoleucine patch superfamily enzyme